VTSPDATLVVRDVAVRAVVVPLRRPLATRVGDFSRWPLLLIDVFTEQGVTGRSYLAPYLDRATAALLPAIRDLGAALRGRPAAPAAVFEQARGWFGLAGYQGLALAAVAGLDIAVWDALAKAAGLPLARLLGGTLAPVPAYNSNGLGLIPPAAAGDEALELLAEAGFTAVKVRVGRATAADDIAAVRRVREAVGDEVTLVADYNQGLTRGEALPRCRALDAEGLSWIEEPLRSPTWPAFRCPPTCTRGLRPPAAGHPDPALAGMAGLGPPGAGAPIRGALRRAAPARRPRQRPGMGRGRRRALPGRSLTTPGQGGGVCSW
jgi:mandelate racemase